MSEQQADKILDATYSLLSRYGLRRTSMEDIVRESGVSRATLFRRFHSRDELLQNLMTREITRFLEGLGERLKTVTDPRDRLVEIFVYFTEIAPKHTVLRRLLETDQETVLPLLTVNSDRLLSIGNNYIRSELLLAAKAGYRLTASPDICAELLTRLSHSYLLNPGSVVPLDDTKKLRRLFRSTVLRLVIEDIEVA